MAKKDTNRNTTLNVYNRPVTNNLSVNETDLGYIEYGHDNKFPQYLIELLNNSSIHGACIASKHDAVMGAGITDVAGGVTMANDFETITELYKKLAYDYLVFGSYAIEVKYSRNRISLFHVDVSIVRAGSKNERGKVPGYYLSTSWDKGRKDLSSLPYLPCFNPETLQEDGSQMLVFSPYRPGLEYYNLPSYMGGIKDIEISSEVSIYHLSNLKNGMSPSIALITKNANATDEELLYTERMLQEAYAGARNAGSMLYMNVPDPELAPEIVQIKNNANDSYYKDLDEVIKQNVITAHQITNPGILGIQTPGKLGINKDEVLNSYTLFQNVVIRPIQKQTLTPLERLLELKYGQDVKLVANMKDIFEGTVDHEETETRVVGSEDTDVATEDKIEETQENQ